MALLENENVERHLRKRKNINYLEAELSFEEKGLHPSKDTTEQDETFSETSPYGRPKKSMHFKKFKYEHGDESDSEDISEYEKQRLKNVEENRKMMLQLGIIDAQIELKNSIVPKTHKKRITKTSTVITTPSKRSLRLQGKTPTGEIFTPVMNDTPKANEPNYQSRKVEGELSMAEDGDCAHMLDKLRKCFSSSSEAKSGLISTVDFERLISDIHGLHLAAFQTKVVNKRIQSLCIHPMESKLLVIAGSVNGSLGLWDVGSDSGLAEYQPHVSPINCISVSKTDHKKLFSTSHDGTVRRADIIKGTFDLVYQTDENEKTSHITWHCELDENTLLVAHGSGIVGVVDLRLGHDKCLTQSFKCHHRSVRTIQQHPVQPQYFLTSSGIGEAKIFDIRKQCKNSEDESKFITVYKSKKSGGGLTSAFFSPNGNKVLTTCNDDYIRIFDITDLQKPKVAQQIAHFNHTGRWLSVFKAKWHPTSSDIFFVGSMQYPKRIQVYSRSGELMREIKSEDLSTICPVLDIHPSQSIVAGGDSVGRVYIFTTKTHVDRLNL